MKIAIIGATGMVGNILLKVLEERNFPLQKLILIASDKSVGKKLKYKGKEQTLISIEEGVKEKPNIAIFSAGSKVSLEWAPRFAKVNTIVIDNSSAWRMDKNKQLIIPEINANKITKNDRIIANPNCSTIQMVLALYPLHKQYKIKRVVVSTYQSITGTGVKAVQQLTNEIKGKRGEMAYPYPIHLNAIPHCDSFEKNAYTKEEIKLVNETKKILNDNTISVTATAVRIPVIGGHSESVNVEFENDFNITEIKKLLNNTKGITVVDNPEKNQYPMPITAQGKDAVFVGRIRRDYSQENSLNLWIVADNLRKGAATNAVQIAEFLITNNSSL